MSETIPTHVRGEADEESMEEALGLRLTLCSEFLRLAARRRAGRAVVTAAPPPHAGPVGGARGLRRPLGAPCVGGASVAAGAQAAGAAGMAKSNGENGPRAPAAGESLSGTRESLTQGPDAATTDELSSLGSDSEANGFAERRIDKFGFIRWGSGPSAVPTRGGVDAEGDALGTRRHGRTGPHLYPATSTLQTD
ncbi:hypothetical protein P7K49_002750 [Saguinus oedipus]|uniref:Uncharacterized protein n=1 Tax=Saguinus oedipus TaxID=9490 RepID=A0ABQ9WI80_SAGOE|nr:hypothetical protein P7K49_002750 [Saguinus oedipus]